MVTKLTKPITRRIGGIVVTITEAGLEVRGYRRHQTLAYTWEQVLSLSPATDAPLLQKAEQLMGNRVLKKIENPG